MAYSHEKAGSVPVSVASDQRGWKNLGTNRFANVNNPLIFFGVARATSTKSQFQGVDFIFHQGPLSPHSKRMLRRGLKLVRNLGGNPASEIWCLGATITLPSRINNSVKDVDCFTPNFQHLN